MSMSRIDNCFNVISKSKAFHGLIFAITFCKPCKLFVNLWTFILFSCSEVCNGYKYSDYINGKINFK